MNCNSFGGRVAGVIFTLLSIVFFGELFLWLFTQAPLVGSLSVGSFLWFGFSFFSGVLSTLLPFGLSFVLLVSLPVRREGLLSSTSTLVALSTGLVFILSFYGALFALAGNTVIDILPKSINHLNDWILVFSGIFVYVLALGEIGLIKMRVSSYGARAPKFIARQGRFGAYLLLGLFLGNIGVGSISPAIPLLLVKATASASVPFGMTLFFLHAMGKVFALAMFTLLISAGVDGASWVAKYRQKFISVNGWLMIFTSSVIVTLGVFSHQWFASSKLYTFLSAGESSPPSFLTQGVFGLPVSFGTLLFLGLLLIPVWWYYMREHRRVYGTPAQEMQKLTRDIDQLESSRRHLEIIAHIPDGEHGKHILHIEREIDALETKRRILEDAERYGDKSGLRDSATQHLEEESLRLRLVLAMMFSLLIVLLAIMFS